MSKHLPQPADLPLHDIHLPPNPPWWPPAPGWWLLAALVCLLIVLAYMAYRRVRRKRCGQARILAEVDQLAMRHANDDAAYAAALHQLLRRVAGRYALEAYHAQGQAWRHVLAQVPVDIGTLDALMTLDSRMYRPQGDFDRHAVEVALKRWVQAALRMKTAGVPSHA